MQADGVLDYIVEAQGRSCYSIRYYSLFKGPCVGRDVCKKDPYSLPKLEALCGSRPWRLLAWPSIREKVREHAFSCRVN